MRAPTVTVLVRDAPFPGWLLLIRALLHDAQTVADEQRCKNKQPHSYSPSLFSGSPLS